MQMNRTITLLCFSGFMLTVTAALDESVVNFKDIKDGSFRQSEFTTQSPSTQSPQGLRCLKPCTRILRPVRAVQNGNVVLLPNMCEFDNAQCRAADARSGPLLLAEDQSNIEWPVATRK